LECFHKLVLVKKHINSIMYENSERATAPLSTTMGTLVMLLQRRNFSHNSLFCRFFRFLL